MKLVDLEPQFMKALPSRSLQRVGTFAEAQGLMFLCPACFTKNNGPVGTHMVLVWFKDRGVPDDAEPLPGRWTVSGTGHADLTLNPSIHLTPSECGAASSKQHVWSADGKCTACGESRACEWHGWVQSGSVT